MRYAHVERLVRRAVSPGGRVLEIGCGAALYRESFGARYVGIDLTREEYKPDVPRDVDAVADAHFLPFGPGTFDVVFFVGVLYQLRDPPHALTEAARVLRPAGTFVVADYNWRTLTKLERGEAKRRPRWTQWGLKRRVEAAGFVDASLALAVEHTGWRGLPPVRLARLVRNELRGGWAIVVARKPPVS